MPGFLPLALDPRDASLQVGGVAEEAAAEGTKAAAGDRLAAEGAAGRDGKRAWHTVLLGGQLLFSFYGMT